MLSPNSLLFENKAGNSVPNATLAAPVSVAKLIIKSFLFFPS